MKQWFRTCVLLLMMFSFGQFIQAQNAVSGGSISGQVTDSSGAAIAHATVIARNTSMGVEAKTATNSVGFYSFHAMKVGSYVLSITQAGFKTAQITGVVVQVGQNTAQNVTLQVGVGSEEVTVTAEAPVLRTTESTVSTVVNQDLISNLPLS